MKNVCVVLLRSPIESGAMLIQEFYEYRVHKIKTNTATIWWRVILVLLQPHADFPRF